ncbi:MAG: hypothetical protein WC679_01605 [Bacteroidales bacterium]|jgi:hypothetical protein
MLPSNFTPDEIAKIADTLTKEELAEQYIKLAESFSQAKQFDKRLERDIEIVEEQSEFRAQLLRDIQYVCNEASPRYKETKSLIHEIILAIENSYVEL